LDRMRRLQTGDPCQPTVALSVVSAVFEQLRQYIAAIGANGQVHRIDPAGMTGGTVDLGDGLIAWPDKVGLAEPDIVGTQAGTDGDDEIGITHSLIGRLHAPCR